MGQWMAADEQTGRQVDGWMENENEGVQHVGVGGCQDAIDVGSACRIQGRDNERKMGEGDEGRRRRKTEERWRKRQGLETGGPDMLGCRVPGAQIYE